MKNRKVKILTLTAKRKVQEGLKRALPYVSKYQVLKIITIVPLLQLMVFMGIQFSDHPSEIEWLLWHPLQVLATPLLILIRVLNVESILEEHNANSANFIIVIIGMFGLVGLILLLGTGALLLGITGIVAFFIFISSLSEEK